MTEITSLLEAITGESATDEARVNDAKLKAFAWARVSTDMQERRGLSIPQQLKEIHEYADKQGIEIAAEFHEAASAFSKNGKRPEFDRMIEKVKSDPEANAIVVHDMSRFSRDSLRAKSLVRELRDLGIRVISLNDAEFDPETPTGVYLEAITYAKNEAHSREIAFHTRKGCRANAQTRDPETGCCYWNGGQPIWGYRIERLNKGIDSSGRPVMKSIIVPDDRVVQGKPVCEWARTVLEMAAEGESLASLRDYCNKQGIPAPRGKYWQVSTWVTLLMPHSLLKYCGYGVWNVHKKNGQKRPPSDWVIVPQAHEALISEATAMSISEHRKRKRREHSQFTGLGGSRNSPYLLSGGLFKCDRCGSNMTGYKSNGYQYYVCGSQPYRRGMGCGGATYVPKEFIESEVVDGIQRLVKVCAQPKGLVKQVNQELRRQWELSCGFDPDAPARIREIEGKIANIRDSIEDGLADVDWANARLAELKQERDQLASQEALVGEPPRINPSEVREYIGKLNQVLSDGTPGDRKRFVGCWIDHIRLAPDALEVVITYKVPEPLLKSPIAGGGFEPPTSGL